MKNITWIWIMNVVSKYEWIGIQNSSGSSFLVRKVIRDMIPERESSTR